jgi:uncharacterized membrane protein
MDALFFHPKVVHLPIALAVLMPVVCAGLLFAWTRGLLPRRTWVVAVVLQIVLVGSSFVAMRSGETDEERVESVVAESVIEAHEEAAELFTWTAAACLLLFAGVLVLRTESSARRAAMAATAASLLVLGLGYRVGQAGGELVYRHGAAAAYSTGAATGGQPVQESAEEDD